VSEEKIISGEEERPCGCRITTYSDESQMFSPCVPCGTYATAKHIHDAGKSLHAEKTRDAGEHLAMAAEAFAAVATRMQAEVSAMRQLAVANAARKQIIVE
jgi:hypothetical protein